MWPGFRLQGFSNQPFVVTRRAQVSTTPHPLFDLGASYGEPRTVVACGPQSPAGNAVAGSGFIAGAASTAITTSSIRATSLI